MDKLLKHLEALKRLTQKQRKALLAGSLELFFSIEEKREAARQSMGQPTRKESLSVEHKFFLSQIMDLEHENRRVLQGRLTDLKKEKNAIHAHKKVSQAYYNPRITQQRATYVNKTF